MSTPRIVDLTLPLAAGMRGFAAEPASTHERDGYNTATLHLYSHAGTHMDAQLHFAAGPETIDQKTPAECMGAAWVVDLAATAPAEILGVDCLGDVAQKLRPGESLLLRTGWSRHAADASLYRDRLPRIGEDLAGWCVEHQVKILGVEPPSVADVNNLQELTRIHRILLSGGVTIVEGLTNLEALSRQIVFFVALPLKIVGGDGCPVRAFAFDGLPAGGPWPT